MVNCGGVSYAAYRLVPIVLEVLQYDPDLIILCTGNNEFLERRTYQDYLAQPLWRRQVLGWVRQSALIRAAQQTLNRPAPPAEALPAEVDALLDYENAMQQYQRDDALAEAVAAHFGNSLERIALATRQARVPLWLVLPLTNLRDCPPFKSQPMTQADGAAAELSDKLANGWFDSPVAARIEFLESILQRDPRLALAHYWLGRSFDEQQDFEAARGAYQRAIDEDVCPLRATSSLLDVLQRQAKRWDWPVIDAAGLLAQECSGSILDNTVLDDHVHPSIDGHQRIGMKLFEEVAAELKLEIDPSVRSSDRDSIQSTVGRTPRRLLRARSTTSQSAESVGSWPRTGGQAG